MTTSLIILGILSVCIIGLLYVVKKHSDDSQRLQFADEFRNKFIVFSNRYFQTYDRYTRTGEFDVDLYVWLTMNVSKIQNHVGSFGFMYYKPPYQNYMINQYAIIINTIPKFRNGQVEKFDAGAVDDCLLKHIGNLEENIKNYSHHIKNPIIWFREGFKVVLSIPFYVLGWFGIISNRKLTSIRESLIYKVISGLVALVTLISSIVTIIVGYDQTLAFIQKYLGK